MRPFAPSIAAIMQPVRRAVKLSRLEGFDRLGLGNPSTLWLGRDQFSVSSIVTRYGFPWSPTVVAPGTLTLDTTSWGFGDSPPLIVTGGGGAAVQAGLDCPQMAGGNSLQQSFTWSCPIWWPAVFGSVQFPFAMSNSQAAATNSRVGPLVFASAVNGQPAASIAAVGQTPPSAAAGPVGFTTTAARRGLYVVTSRMNGGNREWSAKVRVSGFEYTYTSAPIVSVATGVAFDAFSQGYRNLPANYSASNLGFGGACCWKDLGANDAQLTAILDTWANLYPLS